MMRTITGGRSVDEMSKTEGSPMRALRDAAIINDNYYIHQQLLRQKTQPVLNADEIANMMNMSFTLECQPIGHVSEQRINDQHYYTNPIYLENMARLQESQRIEAVTTDIDNMNYVEEYITSHGLTQKRVKPPCNRRQSSSLQVPVNPLVTTAVPAFQQIATHAPPPSAMASLLSNDDFSILSGEVKVNIHSADAELDLSSEPSFLDPPSPFLRPSSPSQSSPSHNLFQSLKLQKTG